ncbi:hypothetical protein ROS62_26195 [Streptomyces sp. DSM 41972]|uniref:Uncharacterized protein n=1 Tax=Streptomyces althioticus subsp. attaecolombicae TaxID=3075534 RepID=A0ABU3I5F0_9ACTN|nr:hypothetical protein [Streptomyces sp. DSM 41972]SCD54754.1 hypothetical protein GA0115245_108510 [Streptomyces sp. di188]SCD55457.1 hypothetical protein GA0115238_11489 [Streptomyces sp. di50b]
MSVAIGSDEAGAVEARARVLGTVAAHGWWVAASRPPFPGLGRLRHAGDGYTWLPVHSKPVDVPA